MIIGFSLVGPHSFWTAVQISSAKSISVPVKLITSHEAIAEAAVMYNADGSVKSVYSYGTAPSVNAVFSDSYLAVVYNTTVIGNDKTVEIVGTDGSKLFSGRLTGELLCMTPHENRLCLLFEDSAVLIDIESGKATRVTVDPNAIDIVFAGDTPLVCYSGNAVALDFEKNGTVIGTEG